MSNATGTVTTTEAMGSGPFIFDVPVKGSTHIYKMGLVAQHSGGYYVPLTASGGGACAGVAQFESDNSSGSDGAKRVRIETERMYAMTNGTSSDAFSDTSVIGAPVYATDDHTAADNSSSATRHCIGAFMGFESDGRVRVFISARYSYLVDTLNQLQLLTDSPANADALRDNIVASLAGLL